jgi:hypothetical protein
VKRQLKTIARTFLPCACVACAWLLVLVVARTSGGAAETLGRFSPEAWRNAASQQSDDWSREPLLKQFAAGTDIRAMPRAEVIHWLGAPGVSQQIYSPGEGARGRIDVYRLSAKNDDSFRIDYDDGDKVTANAIEPRACACELCALTRADAASLPVEMLEGSVLKKDPDGLRKSVTLAEVEKNLGRPGQHHSEDARIGGRMWEISTALWHVSGNPRRFFIASGTVPTTDRKEFDQVLVENFALVEAWPECLPH